MKHKLVLDVDGVLLNFIEAFEQVALSLEDQFKNKLNINENLYDLAERLGISREEEQIVWDKFSHSGTWGNLNPLPGVEESIKKIHDANCEIYIVTAIDEIHKEARLLNLLKIGISPKEIHCVGHGKAKTEYINSINPDIFIDDRLEHLHNAPSVYHLVWLQDGVEQKNLIEDQGVHVSVNSLKEWVDHHMDNVLEKLDKAKKKNMPLQRELKFI